MTSDYNKRYGPCDCCNLTLLTTASPPQAALSLSPDQLEEYRQLFRLFDKAGQGRISWADLGRELQSPHLHTRAKKERHTFRY